MSVGIPLLSSAPLLNLAAIAATVACVWRKDLRHQLLVTLKTKETISTVCSALLGALLITSPIAFSDRSDSYLATVSLGSCDAPDYALGARLIMEKSRPLEGGFWAQSNVHQLGEMDLWTYWTRLNHFGPAAVFAFTSSTFKLPLWGIESAVCCAWAVATASVTLTLARAIFRVGLLQANLIGLHFLISPLALYAVFHVAAGQLVGTLASSTLLLFGFHLAGQTRYKPTWRHIFIGALVGWLMISSYAFMLPAVACIMLVATGLYCIRVRSWIPIANTLIWLVASLILAAVAAPGRSLGLIQGMHFFGGGAFGWQIPDIPISTILGLTPGALLLPAPTAIGLPVMALTVLLTLLSIYARWKVSQISFAVALSALVAFLFARQLLSLLDPSDSGLGSYKLYKLASVLLPLLLTSLVCLGPSDDRRNWILTVSHGVLLIFIILYSSVPFWNAVSRAPLHAGGELQKLSVLEKDARIDGVNIVATHPWDRIWASSLLAEKKQYFADDSYITRGVVPLRGTWMLEDSTAGIYSPSTIRIGDRLIVRPVNEKSEVRIFFDNGWYPHEGTHRWAGADGTDFGFTLECTNPQPIVITLVGRFLTRPELLIATLGSANVPIHYGEDAIHIGPFDVSTGTSKLAVRAQAELFKASNPADVRTLLFKMHRINVTRVASEEPR